VGIRNLQWETLLYAVPHSIHQQVISLSGRRIPLSDELAGRASGNRLMWCRSLCASLFPPLVVRVAAILRRWCSGWCARMVFRCRTGPVAADGTYLQHSLLDRSVAAVLIELAGRAGAET